MRSVLVFDGTSDAPVSGTAQEAAIVAAVESALEGHEGPVVVRSTGEGPHTVLGLVRQVLDEVEGPVVALSATWACVEMARCVARPGGTTAILFVWSEAIEAWGPMAVAYLASGATVELPAWRAR